MATPAPTELRDLLRLRSPAGLAALRGWLAARPPLDPEFFGHLHGLESPFDRAGPRAPAVALSARFAGWWSEMKAAFPIPAELDFRFLRLRLALEWGLGGRRAALVLATTGGDERLIDALEQWGVEGACAQSYCRRLLCEAWGVVYGVVTELYGLRRRKAHDHIYPFYVAVRYGWAEHVQAAADWCSPSPATVRHALMLPSVLAARDDRGRSVLEWLFVRASDVAAATLLALDDRGRASAAAGDFYRRILFEAPALSPGRADALLALPDGAHGWARPALERAARLKLRFAWILAVAAAARQRPSSGPRDN